MDRHGPGERGVIAVGLLVLVAALAMMVNMQQRASDHSPDRDRSLRALTEDTAREPVPASAPEVVPPEVVSGPPPPPPIISINLDWLKARGPAAGLSWNTDPADILEPQAVSALAVLAFLWSGYDTGSGYATTVRRALAELLFFEQQGQVRGVFVDPGADRAIASQAIVTMALAEAYAMTGSNRLRAPTLNALDVLAKHQLAANDDGYRGWSSGPTDPDPDLFTTSWVLIAFLTARVAGFDVPDGVWPPGEDRIVKLFGAGVLADALIVASESYRSRLGCWDDKAETDRTKRLEHVVRRRPGTSSLSVFELFFATHAVCIGGPRSAQRSLDQLADGFYRRPIVDLPDRWPNPPETPYGAGPITTGALLQLCLCTAEYRSRSYEPLGSRR